MPEVSGTTDTPRNEQLLRIDGVSKRFGSFTAVDNVSLTIGRGEFFALLGPSGCGKSTLLRMIAGFEFPDSGRILLDDDDLAAAPPYERPVNMVFQSYALFPHLTVAGNVGFGLRQEGWPRAAIDARVQEMLTLVKLEPFGERMPHQLSGGQRQRVALARALAKSPKIFLLDEPLAALDKKLRDETQFELMALQQRLNLTFIIVTHDQGEAMTMADRIGVMHQGKLVQVGTPAQIYEAPRSRWIAEFIGEANLLEGKVASTASGVSRVDTKVGQLALEHEGQVTRGESVTLVIRPEKIAIGRDKANDAANALAGSVADVAYLGDQTVYQVRHASGVLLKAAAANTSRAADGHLSRGAEVWLSFAPAAAVLIRN